MNKATETSETQVGSGLDATLHYLHPDLGHRLRLGQDRPTPGLCHFLDPIWLRKEVETKSQSSHVGLQGYRRVWNELICTTRWRRAVFRISMTKPAAQPA